MPFPAGIPSIGSVITLKGNDDNFLLQAQVISRELSGTIINLHLSNGRKIICINPESADKTWRYSPSENLPNEDQFVV